MAATYTGKIRGLTSGSATVATQDVVLHDDGVLRFTFNSVKYEIHVGKDPAVAALIKSIFTGGSGLTSGQKVFGQP